MMSPCCRIACRTTDNAERLWNSCVALYILLSPKNFLFIRSHRHPSQITITVKANGRIRPHFVIGIDDSTLLPNGYRFPCHKMNSKYVDGMKFENVYYAISELVERCKNNKGPSLIEIKTYRYKGHSMSDAQTYRSKEEINNYIKIDPITQILKFLRNFHLI